MSRHTGKNGRTKTTVLVALAALAIGGGATIGYAEHDAGHPSTQSVAPALAEAGIPASERTVTLYKSPTCTCCAKWGDHLREAGFDVREVVTEKVHELMEERGVPMHLRSCHLGVVNDYVLVGHVPADLAVRLLKQKPAVSGIAVPGMPLGSPGMEAFGRTDRYHVTAFGPEGVEYVFESR